MIPVLITTTTATSAGAISFTTGLDDTYHHYMFVITGIGPETDGSSFSFNGSKDGGSNYNVNKTTQYTETYHAEDNASQTVQYHASYDEAESTGYQVLSRSNGSAAAECGAGIIHLFNPSSTVFCTNFISVFNWASSHASINGYTTYVGGYFNDTDNIDGMDFKMSAGDMDGTIQMYGIE